MGQRAGLATRRGRVFSGVSIKVTALLLAALIVTLIPLTLLSLRAQQQDLYAAHDRRGHEIARLLARLLSERVAGNDAHGLDTLLQELVRQPDVVYARIENRVGETLATSGVSPDDPDHTPGFREELHANGAVIGRVVVGLSTEQVIQTLAQRQHQALWSAGLVFLAVLTVALMAMSALVARPLAVVTGTLRAGTRSGPVHIGAVPLYGNDEFSELAQELNILGRRLNDTQHTVELRETAIDPELRDAGHRPEIRTEGLHELNRELAQRDLTDPLTGLHNQRYFEILMDTEVERCVRNDETISILLIDINDLPARVEQAGRHGGDELIRAVAQVVADHTKAADASCRYGSVGFVMLCRRATIASAIALADDLQRGLAEHSFVVHGHARQLTASVGIATIPGVHRVTSAAHLIECAEEALRHSRQSGHAVVHYSMLERHSRFAAR